MSDWRDEAVDLIDWIEWVEDLAAAKEKEIVKFTFHYNLPDGERSISRMAESVTASVASD